MEFTHSTRSGGNVAGKSGTAVTSALDCDITESIADSMLHADTTFRLVPWASTDPVDVIVFGGLGNCGWASEPSDLTTTSFCSCRLPISSCCGLPESTTLEPCMRSANIDDLLSFGGLLQPNICWHYQPLIVEAVTDEYDIDDWCTQLMPSTTIPLKSGQT